MSSCQAEANESQVCWRILVSGNDSWVGTGQHGSTGAMTAWDVFSSNQRKPSCLAVSPKLVSIKLLTHTNVQTSNVAFQTSQRGFSDAVLSDAVFNVIRASLADNNQRFVVEVEAIEL